jgi:hypothetical protein
LFSQAVWPLPGGLLSALMWAVFASSLASGAVYVGVWGGRYWRETRPLG